MTPGYPTVVPAAVVICSRDRPALLLDTVRSVLAGDAVPRELVIVDQSTAPHPALAALGIEAGCEIRYVPSQTVGLSRARNIGLRSAREDVVVMIDDDMLVEPGWLRTLVAEIPPGPGGVATGRVLAAPPEPGGGTVVPPAALVTRDEPATFRGRQPLDVVPGANIALRRAFVLALGGYDERLGAGTRFAAADDNDMGHRLLNAGAEVRHVPEAVVLHRAWRPSGDLIRLRWGYARGKGAFYAKHRGRWMLRRAMVDVAHRLRRAAAGLRRSPRRTAAELLSIAGIVSGALDWLLREQVAGSLRRPRG